MPDKRKPRSFTYSEYRRAVADNLNEQVANLELSKAQRDEYLVEIDRLISQKTPLDELPDYFILKGFAATSYGEVLIPGRVLMFDGEYFTPDGLYLNADVVDRERTKYFGTEAGQLTEYERRSLALQESRFEREGLESERDRLEKANQQSSGYQRALQEKDFELWKSQTVASLDQPVDWIKRWEIMHTPNPLSRPQTDWTQSPIGVLAGKRWEDMTPLERGAVNAMDATINPRTENQLSFYPNARNEGLPAGAENTGAPFPEPSWMPLSTQEARQIIADINQKAGILASAQVSDEPRWTAPPAPSWLPDFVPNQRTGQAITRAAIVTPSGQQWSRTAPSVREGLRGYANWAGGRPLEDIQAEMESMLPKTRSASYASWRPRRQAWV